LSLNLLLMLSGSLVFLGICGALCRRNLLAISLCLHVAFLGITLFISVCFAEHGDIKAVSLALILIVIFSLQIMFTGGLVIFIYRNQGTLHIDEMRQLRG
jgi:NADH:ubiquinone oxidoreductase subunit K